MPPARHLLPPCDISSAGNGLHIVKFGPKGSHGNPQVSQAIVKAIGSSPQTDGKALVLKQH